MHHAACCRYNGSNGADILHGLQTSGSGAVFSIDGKPAYSCQFGALSLAEAEGVRAAADTIITDDYYRGTERLPDGQIRVLFDEHDPVDTAKEVSKMQY